MNILIPHTWLLEHLETEASPQQIQQYLSLAGPSIERIYNREGDSVYDIEITTNRVDAMSVRGVAREAAVILNQFGIAAKLKPLRLPAIESLVPSINPLPAPTVFNDPNLNKRTIFIVLQNVQRTATPDWMAKRLRQIDMNVHDAAIDITNYVTHDLGHPCHAFDYDKLMKTGGEIHITEADAGETFTTLDGTTFTTVGGEVVFKNAKNQIIDLPSIKGTQNTSIDESTTNVLLLLESIRPDKVRFASMTHAIRTTAAQLMEKDVDPHLAETVLQAGVQRYQQLCGATIASKVHDVFSNQSKPMPITISLAHIDLYLGIELPIETVVEILEQLECVVAIQPQPNRQAVLTVTPPTFRPDLTIPADLIEEVARIYGYHNLPSTLMDTAIPLSKPAGVDFNLENRVKHFLADIGWQELYTYSMVSAEIAGQSGRKPDSHLKMSNPLTDDRVYLRRSLLPSLEEVISTNPNRSQQSVFEISNVYQPKTTGQLPTEALHLTLVSSRSYRLVRGDLEALLNHLFVPAYRLSVQAKPSINYSQQAGVEAKNKQGQWQSIGSIGVLASGHIGIDITMSDLLQVVRTHPAYQPIPKTMPILEDLTFTLPRKEAIGTVIDSITEISPLIKKVNVKDIYQQNVTFTIEYHDLKHNLAVEDIKPLREKIVSAVQSQHHGKLVGTVL